MKKLLLLFSALITTIPSIAQDGKEDNTTTYYLIRHAEKDRSDQDNKNPNLKQEGLARALEWAETFKDVSFDVIYSTDYNRTRQTAAPTSLRQNKVILLYDPFELDIEEFKKQTKGKVVLIVGHSNTTPDFANKLIGKDTYEAMDDSDNAGLYIVTIVRDIASSIRLSVN
ncbi:SixA phosphatase family protein [Ascidiimonas sp. W6]|uniref:SixA phosphatase family protein n=1 Tax=Ascidiimonas meishanensis TaxID=3128903 RepID=UPI0030EDF346